MRRIFAFALLLALFSRPALAAGSYQRTRDTGVLVWNDQPRAGQEVTWSGRKDRAGYATGYGTLTWFAPDRAVESGSNIPSRHHMVVVARVSGKMEQGKFIDRKNRAKGTPAPALIAKTPPSREQASPKKTPSPRASPSASPSPPPSPTPSDKSLNSLTRPPSSLQLNSPAEASPHPTPTPDASTPPYP